MERLVAELGAEGCSGSGVGLHPIMGLSIKSTSPSKGRCAVALKLQSQIQALTLALVNLVEDELRQIETTPFSSGRASDSPFKRRPQKFV